MNQIIKKNLFTSKDPVGLAGTFVYMACKRYDERIVQYEIASARVIKNWASSTDN
jgi:transcription initiation factor TFIIIB Brf1 subunit/transcription initiation factor TFIIB